MTDKAIVETDKSFPRVLVISATPLAACNATGITLSNLFFAWPKDRIAQIYDDKVSPDPSICARYKRLPANDALIFQLGKSLLGKSKKKSSNVKKDEADIFELPRGRGITSAVGDCVPFLISSEIKSWVREFKPEVIYSLLGNIRIMKAALQISSFFRIPIVPHFMDDWPETLYADGLLKIIPNYLLQKNLRYILSQSNRRITIGQDMSMEFKRRYGGDFDYIMNCVPIEKIRNKTSDQLGLKFVFSGGLHLGRFETLLAIVKVMQLLKTRWSGLEILIFAPLQDLKLYGPKLASYSVVRGVKTLAPNDVYGALLDADVLVHAESFEQENARYTRFSISTKIPQYMASGRPVLACGPSDLSSMRYLLSVEAGLVVSNFEDSDLRVAIEALVESAELREKLGNNGFSAACLHHEASQVRTKMKKIISEAAEP